MENDLISRSALKSFLCKCCNVLHSDEPCEPSDCNVMEWVDELPAVDAVYRGVFDQVLWERNTAFEQLEEHGIPFGGTAPDVVKVLLCAFCAKFDTSGYDNSNEDDLLLQVGHCKYWGKRTQGCGFCDQRERRAEG